MVNRMAMVLLLAAAVAAAQQPAGMTAGPQQPAPRVAATNISERVDAPTYSDVYCAGFITNQSVGEVGYVAASWNSPHATKYADRDYVYLRGNNFQPAAEYQILRRVKDPNEYEIYQGQNIAISSLGQPYAEIGRVKVLDILGNIAITQVQFACDGITPGDIAVAQVQQTIPPYHGPVSFDRFAPPNGKLQARIVLAREFDYILGPRHKVYLSAGADQGVKVGDYFRAVRDYEMTRLDPVDGLSTKASIVDDTRKNAQRLPAAEVRNLPRRALGELIVVDVTPRASTAMITFSLEAIQIGDTVEMMEVPPMAAQPAAPPMAPSISCYANPATVRQGDSATIACDAASPDNRPLTFAFQADRGQLAQRDNTAVLGTRDAGAGPIAVNATVTDDRNMSAGAVVMVNVEAPPPAPQPSLAGEAIFRARSAYVDNRAKAMLDGIALRMQQAPGTNVVVMGFSDAGEPRTLGQRRANNVKTYLVQKGIDAGRIDARAGSGGGQKAEVWLLPAGATMP